MSEKTKSGYLKDTEFEINKREYFYRLGLKVRKALQPHKAWGLWDRIPGDPERKRDWGNVSEHCLVVVARGEAFADLLGFSPAVRNGLMLAATVHDFYKRGFREATRNSADPRADTLRAEEESARIIEESRLQVEAVEIVKILGDSMITVAGKIAEQPVLSELDQAKLVLRYIDDYTMGSSWVDSVDSSGKNSLDRRVDVNDANPKYYQNSEQWREHLGGESLHEAQRRVGHLIEGRLTEIINTRCKEPVEPLSLPQFIDETVKQRIQNLGDTINIK